MFWQRTVKESLEYAESTINVREPLIALNQNLNVISVSRSPLCRRRPFGKTRGFRSFLALSSASIYLLNFRERALDWRQ
jgi:hypothetical protein